MIIFKSQAGKTEKITEYREEQRSSGKIVVTIFNPVIYRAGRRRTLCARNWNSSKKCGFATRSIATICAFPDKNENARRSRLSFARSCRGAEHVSPFDFYQLLALQTGSYGNRPRPGHATQCTFSAPALCGFGEVHFRQLTRPIITTRSAASDYPGYARSRTNREGEIWRFNESYICRGERGWSAIKLIISAIS